MDLREGIEDDRGYHDPDFSPNLRYVLGFEVDDTLNWKVNLSYYNLWVVDGLSKKVLPGSGASGTDPVWNLDGAIGKDLWTSKKGSFKLKPWGRSRSDLFTQQSMDRWRMMQMVGDRWTS